MTRLEELAKILDRCFLEYKIIPLDISTEFIELVKDLSSEEVSSNPELVMLYSDILEIDMEEAKTKIVHSELTEFMSTGLSLGVLIGDLAAGKSKDKIYEHLRQVMAPFMLRAKAATTQISEDFLNKYISKDNIIYNNNYIKINKDKLIYKDPYI